jgi:hypothetical protein
MLACCLTTRRPGRAITWLFAAVSTPSLAVFTGKSRTG